VNSDQQQRMSLDYLHWNLQRVGKDEQRKGFGYWYRDTVFFNDGTPITRFVTAPRKTKILLVKHGGLVTTSDYPVKFESRIVPDIGAFSRYEDDMLPEEELHERIRYIMLQQVREFTALNVEPLTDKMLAEANPNYGHGSLQQRMSNLYAQHDSYARLFELKWSALPNMYREQLADTIRMKIDRWNDPAAVARRTRAQARKLAVKALAADN
jgi:hypothetical protein